MLATCYKGMKDMENKLSCIKSIRVTTGFDCNCKCHYCSQRNNKISDRLGGVSTQIQTLYVLLKQPCVIKEGDLNIELEGGEPLLHPDIIMDTVKLCDQLNTDSLQVRYTLVSNCQLLNKSKARELIKWMKDRGSNFSIAVSFDHQYKNPRILNNDTYRFLRECGAMFIYAVYVIESKKHINLAKRNITFLNEHGIKPLVYWNFFAYGELNDLETRTEYVKLLRETKNRNKQGIGFSGEIKDCAWIGISPKGKIYPCYEASFGIADLAKGKEFERSHCMNCDIKSFCKQCVVRKALYGDKLCGLMRAQYALENCKEVT